ncbi:hypothetical protein PFY10_07330 [Chryseobacterium daecheongense]|nr:hypothetical protein PFY10_07330 [Chryseobacterium daecheongense]
MKNVTGAKKAVGGGICDDWSNDSYDVCFNCCVAWASNQPSSPSDPGGLEECSTLCARNGAPW